MSELLYGRHAVLEALRANRRHFFRLWIEGEGERQAQGIVADILDAAAALNLPVRATQQGLFDRLQKQNANHQGVALEVGNYPYVDSTDLIRGALKKEDPPLLLLLDHLQDPQNLGTLIRTAEAMGVHGVLIPERRSAGITPAVSNASAGAVEHLPLAQVTNLNQTIEHLKKANIWVAGLDMGPDALSLAQADLSGALALVVGSEGSGLSRLTRERCDFTVRLSMYGHVESLNAAVAGSIVLFLVRQSRKTPAAEKRP